MACAENLYQAFLRSGRFGCLRLEDDCSKRCGNLRFDRISQRLATVTGRIADMEDDIGDRVVVELTEGFRQFQPPFTVRAGAFEGQIAQILEVGVEETGVLLCTGGDNRLDADE